jgi:hypothetical protein
MKPRTSSGSTLAIDPLVRRVFACRLTRRKAARQEFRRPGSFPDPEAIGPVKIPPPPPFGGGYGFGLDHDPIVGEPMSVSRIQVPWLSFLK